MCTRKGYSMEVPNQFGVIGLGRMGADLALQAMEKGYKTVGYTLGAFPPELKKAGMIPAKTPTDFQQLLTPPRIIFLYIPAGAAVDELLEELSTLLSSGDIIVDGGNSYWGDSIRRQKKLSAKQIDFIDLGTSGGVSGARTGACFMAGGKKSAVALIQPILEKLAVPGGFVYAGGSGAGHFTKLVHNGIEFGMLQAIGEGMALLTGYREPLPIPDILECWRHGSVIRSWLIDLMAAGYKKENGLKNIPSYVDDTGEVNWLVMDALEMAIPVPVIALSVMQLLASRDDKQIADKAIALMRHGFGGHPLGGPHPDIVNERQKGRIGGFYKDD